MSDYISRKDVLAALSGLLKDIKENPIGNGEDAYKDGIWKGEKDCAIEAILRIKALPAADAKPVVRGMWLTQEYMYGTEDYEDEWIERRAEEGDTAYCSICGATAGLDGAEDYVLSNFCPNCGADMRGEKSND